MCGENTKYYYTLKNSAYTQNHADSFSEIEVHDDFTLVLRIVQPHCVHTAFSSGKIGTLPYGFNLKLCSRHTDIKVISNVGSVQDDYIIFVTVLLYFFSFLPQHLLYDFIFF